MISGITIGQLWSTRSARRPGPNRELLRGQLAGIPHGPHPGTVEASIGKEGTEELAVMVDTFHPLKLTTQALELDDDRYPYSWLPPEDAGKEASELVLRGPEAFPD
jgi:hypothetical protein